MYNLSQYDGIKEKYDLGLVPFAWITIEDGLAISQLACHWFISTYQHRSFLFLMRTRGWKLKPVIVILSYLEPTGGLLMDWILLTQTSGCSRKPLCAPNVGICNLLHSQCMPKNEHYSSICTTAREHLLLFHMAKGTAKARPSLPCGSEPVKSERKREPFKLPHTLVCPT